MPQFRITDSVSGKTVTVSGDSAPTDEEAQQIFSDAGLHTAGAAPTPVAEAVPQRAMSPTTRSVMTEGAATAPKLTDPGFPDARPMLPTIGEAVGGMGGELLGGPVVSGLGAAAFREMGHQAANALGEVDPRTALERYQEFGKTGAANAIMPLGFRLAGQGIREGAKMFMRMGPDAAEVANRLADAKGWFNPSVSVVTENAARDLSHARSVQLYAAKAAERVAKEANTRVKALSERGASNMATGAAIRIGSEQGANRFSDTAKVLYNQFDVLVPGQTNTTFENIRGTLKELTTPTAGAEASTSALINPRAKQLAAALEEDIRKGQAAVVNGELQPLTKVEALRAIRSRLGAELGQPQIGPDSIPYGALKRLYASASDDLRIAAQRQGPEALKAFDRADTFYRNGIDEIEKLVKPFVDGKIEQSIAPALLKTGAEGAQVLSKFRQELSPDQWKLVASNAMQKLISSSKGTIEGIPERFDFAAFAAKWKDVPDDTKEVLFGNMGGVKEDLERLARTSLRVSRGSPSLTHAGTPLAVAGGDRLPAQAGMVGAFGGGALGAAGAVISTLAATAGAGHLMTNPKVVHWLAQGTNISPNGAGAWIGRLGAIAADTDPATRGAIQEFLGNLQSQPGG